MGSAWRYSHTCVLASATSRKRGDRCSKRRTLSPWRALSKFSRGNGSRLSSRATELSLCFVNRNNTHTEAGFNFKADDVAGALAGPPHFGDFHRLNQSFAHFLGSQAQMGVTEGCDTH